MTTFKYSYEECLACDNSQVRMINENAILLDCPARSKEIYVLTHVNYVGCDQFKPKQQEPKMTEKEFNITDYKPEQLQLRGGQEIVATFSFTDLETLVVYKAKYGGHQALALRNSGRYHSEEPHLNDVILKPKPKKLVAPFIKKHPDGDLTISVSYKTKEDADIYCLAWDLTLYKWPAPGFEPIEIDE